MYLNLSFTTAYFSFRDSTWEAVAEEVAVAGIEVQAPYRGLW